VAGTRSVRGVFVHRTVERFPKGGRRTPSKVVFAEKRTYNPAGKMKAVFMGTPEFSVPVLEGLERLGLDVVAVYTRPDKPKGRGLGMEAPPVKRWARQRKLKVMQPPSLRSPDAQKELAALHPEVIVVAAYGQILPQEVLRIPAKGCVNVHPSLLPLYRGTSPVVTALLEGAEVTGVTLMLMDEGMDTGPVLARRQERVRPFDTTETLTRRLFLLGAELVVETLPRWLVGKLVPQPQDEARATVTRLVRGKDGEADWALPAYQLERRVRAYTPWPGLYTHWKGRRLKVLQATVVPGEGQAGLVVPLDQPEAACGVVTGQAILGLNTLLMESRRPVSSREFVQGYRDFVGSRLPS